MRTKPAPAQRGVRALRDHRVLAGAGLSVFLARVASSWRAPVPHLGRDSSIINTGSVTGLEGSAQLLDYSATKGAIHAFTKSLANKLLERGIRVNAGLGEDAAESGGPRKQRR